MPRLFDQMVMLTDEARREVGFDITNIEREIAVDAPPSELRVLDVAVDPSIIDEATASDPLWSDRREEVDREGGTYVDWSAGGDELAADPKRVSPMRPLGVGGQLAVEEQGDGARVVRTKESALMEDALATAAGDGESAADGVLAGVAEALDGDVVQVLAVIGPSSGIPANLTAAQVEQLADSGGFIGPYRALVLADYVVDGDDRTEVLVVHASEEAAEANAAAIVALLDNGATTMSGVPVTDVLGDATVAQDGTIVRVRVEPGHFAAISRGITSGDIFVTQ